jgi:hypothetical protein
MPKSRHCKKPKRRTVYAGRDERISVMRRVSHFPLRECRINDDWSESRLANLTFARNRPDGHVAIGVFVVDLGCLGVKSAFANPDITLVRYEQQIVRGGQTNQILFDPACAVKMITGAVEYADKLGFKPDPDYYYSREIFGDIDPGSCQETFEYGGDGKPFYFAGPYDDADKIMKHLMRKLGPDGFHYLIPLNPFDSEDESELYDDEEEEEDEL